MTEMFADFLPLKGNKEECDIERTKRHSKQQNFGYTRQVMQIGE
tara:strand:- start:673 stop:804 length:132 start_codon:yes stop_codon:yes gene_type:complete